SPSDTALHEMQTHSLHDALPIFEQLGAAGRLADAGQGLLAAEAVQRAGLAGIRSAREDQLGPIVVRQLRGTCTGKQEAGAGEGIDRKSTRLNSSHVKNSYAVFCL